MLHDVHPGTAPQESDVMKLVRLTSLFIASALTTATLLAADIPLTNWSAPPTWYPHTASKGRLQANAGESDGMPFISINPCRMYDSRTSDGPLDPWSDRVIDPAASSCGPFPEAVGAYSINITVFGSSGTTFHFLTVFPWGKYRPDTSTLNFRAGEQVTGSTVAPAGVLGRLSVTASTSTHLVMDINGYYSTVLPPQRKLHVEAIDSVAIHATSLNSAGIYAVGGTEGVYGIGGTAGVRGHSESATGVWGSGHTGMHGSGYRGVSGNGHHVGVVGRHATSWKEGRLGYQNGSDYYGVWSEGNAHVNGTLSKSGGSFRIDHPLEPEEKYLSHSFVESPDMMNIYNGNVVVDAAGRAVVQMPPYFDALNRDFRYQLTPIGGFAELYIEQKIVGNQFVIAGGKPGQEVSWQVTGVRKDPWAEKNRIQVEEPKAESERGRYLNPEVYDKPAALGIGAVAPQ